MTRRLPVVVAVLAVAITGTACTGVPTSSTPQVIQSVPLVQPQQPAVVTPQAGENPRAIVLDFLQNNAADDEHVAAARAFLTPEEKNRWSDAAGATVYDSVHVGLYDATTSTVTVSGHQVGTISPSGLYTPTLQGDGVGGDEASLTQTIGLKQVDGQWRISSLSFSGVLISENQFNLAYTPRDVYFYDLDEQRLVPDLRYSSLTDPQALATWLMQQLAGLPSGSSLNTDLPQIPNAAQLRVTVGAQLGVDLPGAGQLDDPTKARMAAQVALTLDQAVPNAAMQITDGGQPVVIPQLGSSIFRASDFESLIEPATLSPDLYFVYKGGVYDASSGKSLPGVGSGSYSLTSVALTAIAGSAKLRVAGTSGAADNAELLLGESGAPLHTVGLTGPLSRPSWMPGLDEVWIGDGAKLYRVGSDGKPHQVPIQVSAGTVSGRVVAVRISPDGARVALVIASMGGTSPVSQIWVGIIARSPQSVQVTGLHQISPPGVRITDVGWSDLRKLYAIGTDVAGGGKDPNVYDVECDGSFWTPNGIGNLPGPPDSITAARGGVPAVSASGTVWKQDNGTWISPESGTTYGTNPVYAE